MRGTISTIVKAENNVVLASSPAPWIAAAVSESIPGSVVIRVAAIAMQAVNRAGRQRAVAAAAAAKTAVPNRIVVAKKVDPLTKAVTRMAGTDLTDEERLLRRTANQRVRLLTAANRGFQALLADRPVTDVFPAARGVAMEAALAQKGGPDKLRGSRVAVRQFIAEVSPEVITRIKAASTNEEFRAARVYVDELLAKAQQF